MPSSYIVKSGDTLQSISAKIYGDSAKFTSILYANSSISSSGQELSEGQELIVPALASSVSLVAASKLTYILSMLKSTICLAFSSSIK